MRDAPVCAAHRDPDAGRRHRREHRIFSLVNALMLHPLPLREPSQPVELVSARSLLRSSAPARIARFSAAFGPRRCQIRHCTARFRRWSRSPACRRDP
jgi:hypothetical protein